jgi:hypothetical protein
VRAGKVYLAAILFAAVLGAALRLAWVAERNAQPPARRGGWRSQVAFPGPTGALSWLHDEYLYYVSTAVNAFEGRGFVPDYNTVRDGVYVPPPMQSLFVLALFGAAGRIVHPWWLQLAQVVLSALMILLAAELLRRLVSPLAGAVLALLLAVHPDFVYWPAYLMTESNYAVGLAVLLYLLARWAERPCLALAFAAGACLGMLHLQRVNGLFLGIVLALWALKRPGGRDRVRSALAFALVPFLVLLPWLARNLAVYGEPILVNSNAGVHLHFANHASLDARATPYLDDALAKGGVLVPELEARYRNREGKLRSKLTYYDYSQAYLGIVRSYVLDDPLHFLGNYVVKLGNQFTLIQDTSRQSVPFLAAPGRYEALHWVVLLGGLAGLVCSLATAPRGGRVLIAIVFAYYALMGGLSILEKDGRYNLNLKLFLLSFLSAGLGLLWQSLQRRTAARTTR